MMRLFKSWKWYEIVMLFISLLAVVLCFVFSEEKNWLSLVNSVIGIISVLAVSKGLIYAPVINIIFLIIYGVLSATLNYWGEVLICVFVTLPVCISSIVSWFKNRSSENRDIVVINKVSAKEYGFLFIAIAVITVGAYFLLWALNTNQLIISTISIVTSVGASYLLFRRSPYYAIGYILNDFVLISLWTMSVINYGLGNLPTLVSFCIFLFNDSYGLFRWLKSAKSSSPKTEQIEKNESL